jgi:hypothetical protein
MPEDAAPDPHNETADPRDKPWTKAVYWLKTHIALVAAALLAVSGVAFYFLGGMPEFVTDPPTWARVVAAGGVAGALLSWSPAERVVNWLFQVQYVYFLDVDPLSRDVSLYELTPRAFALTEVVEGEINPLSAKHRLYGVTNFDKEELTCEGTWRGSVSDLELVADREEIEDIRQKLEKDAQKGIAHRVREPSIIRRSVDKITTALVVSFESSLVANGEEIQNAVEEVLDDHIDLDTDTDGTESDPEEVVDAEELREDLEEELDDVRGDGGE